MTCPRCSRPLSPWPLRRPDTCSAAAAAVCVRQYADVRRELQRRAAKRVPSDDLVTRPDTFLANHSEVRPCTTNP